MPEPLPARSPQWEMGLFTDWVVENWPKATIVPVEAGALALAPGGC